MEHSFVVLSSKEVAEQIGAAQQRVVYAAPGLTRDVARAILDFAQRSGTEHLEIVIDCSEDGCRLGLGDAQAVRDLLDAGCPVKQSSGLRVGMLVCDEITWCFAPSVLCVEEEPGEGAHNAVRLGSQQAGTLSSASDPDSSSAAAGGVETAPSAHAPDLTADGVDYIGAPLLSSEDLEQVEEALKLAPPIRFDVSRRVRVFQPYLQYVELHLRGCAVDRRKVQIPLEVFGVEATDEVATRLRTTYDLIAKKSELSDRRLTARLDKIRSDYAKPLGKNRGRVVLRARRSELDAELDALEQQIMEHQKQVEEGLQKEIEASKAEIVKGVLERVTGSPPPELAGQITTDKPTGEQATKWVEGKLAQHFPSAQEVVSQMKLERTYKDITYETLNNCWFESALRKAFPLVDWEKPFSEFDASREKGANVG